MAINYKAYEFQCYEHIRHMEGLLQFGENQGELQTWCLKAEQLRKNLESRRFRVAVVGEFNRGKTSFVNALLGKEILPADYMPTTAAINRITYGDTPSAYVVLKNGQKQHVQIAELAGYITKLSASALETALKIDEAVVQYPSLFCRNGVDLLDTPGMNDEESMNQVTVSRLEDIDLAIVAVDASMPFSMTERTFTAQLLESPQVCQIIVVITKIDMIRPKERQKLIDFMTSRIKEDIKEYLERTHTPDDSIMQKYHSVFDNPCVFAVSSLDALDALAQNDMTLFEESGFLHLNEQLPQIILSSQNRNVIINSMRMLLGLVRSYRSWLIKRQEYNQELIPKIQAKEADIAKAYRKYCASAFEFKNNVSFDYEHCHTTARKFFVQALSQMQALRYDELQRVFSPAIRKAFQAVSAELRDCEASRWNTYQAMLDQTGAACTQELGAIMAPFPMLCQCVQPELDAVSNSFALPEDSQAESFYWVYSPIPDAHTLGSDWQVMPFVDMTIRASLQNYQFRRKKELDRLLIQSENQLFNRLNAVTAQFHEKLQQHMQQLSKGPEQQVLDALYKLEQNCQALLKRFQAELHSEA